MSYFKLVTILGLLILLVFVFYLNNKNKLEQEKQFEAFKICLTTSQFENLSSLKNYLKDCDILSKEFNK